MGPRGPRSSARGCAFLPGFMNGRGGFGTPKRVFLKVHGLLLVLQLRGTKDPLYQYSAAEQDPFNRDR